MNWPDLSKNRHPGDGDVALAAVGRRARELEVTERQVGIERLPMHAPSLLVGLRVGHFPTRFTKFRARRGGVSNGFGELLADEAMVRIWIPSTRRKRTVREYENALRSPAEPPRIVYAPSGRRQRRHLGPVARRTQRHSDRVNRHAASVLTEILFLEWLYAPCIFLSPDPPSFVPIEPFRRCQGSPEQATRGEILTVVPHDAQSRVVGLQNGTFRLHR